MRRSFSPIGWPVTQEPLEDASFAHAEPLAEAIPDHRANTVNDQVTATPIPSQGGVDTPSFGQVPSSTSPSKECACIVCLRVGIIDINNRGPYRCHLMSCNWICWAREADNAYETYSTWAHQFSEKKRSAHEKTHYQRGPKDPETPFSCPVENCRFSSKRWSDLHRHTTAKHCKNPPKFACSVIGCKYNGEDNGFIRKDKLKDHYKNMHQGLKVPGQAVRAIKPAPAPFPYHAEASGSSSIGAQGE